MLPLIIILSMPILLGVEEAEEAEIKPIQVPPFLKFTAEAEVEAEEAALLELLLAFQSLV
jgi:hypothetical protein